MIGRLMGRMVLLAALAGGLALTLTAQGVDLLALWTAAPCWQRYAMTGGGLAFAAAALFGEWRWAEADGGDVWGSSDDGLSGGCDGD